MHDQESYMHDETTEPLEELPLRPRRRLLRPLPLTLLAVLLLACGFIAGVLVEKGQSSSAGEGAGSGLASRFAALRGAGGGSARTGSAAAGSSVGTGTGAGGSAGSAAAGGASGRTGFGGAGAGGGSATVGQVAFVHGKTLYVTDSEGNTVKVLGTGASVSKTVSTSVAGIHPGETVVVTGKQNATGAVSAESIRVGGTGALFSGAGAGRSSGGAAGLKLFGSGG
jgi:hypothetical protein